MMEPKSFLKNIFRESLDRCSPSTVVSEAVSVDSSGRLHVRDQQFEPGTSVYVLAVGKASLPMYGAVHCILGSRLASGLVITPDQQKAGDCPADKVIVSAHPTPDERSMKAGRTAVQFLENIPEDSLLVTLISGGTSSLLCLPPEGIPVDDLNRTFDLLNESGARIREINTVRKHCSVVKGGQLLSYLNPRVPLIDLVISDVPGDDLSIIGSGPTTPDDSTYQDAYHILLEYDLWDHIPDSIHTHIEKGLTGEVPETVKPDSDPLRLHQSYIISSARNFAVTAGSLAQEKDFQSYVAEEAYNEDVAAVASMISSRIEEFRDDYSSPALLIFYGESTVNVTGDGKGGRNQELALLGALEIAGKENITWMSAGTDGVDGPTDAAGAIVDGKTVETARLRGIDPKAYLKDNDSYHFHERMGTLFKTGPTGNNLMDIVLVLIE